MDGWREQEVDMKLLKTDAPADKRSSSGSRIYGTLE